jgi:hypothetical protein
MIFLTLALVNIYLWIFSTLMLVNITQPKQYDIPDSDASE